MFETLFPQKWHLRKRDLTQREFPFLFLIYFLIWNNFLLIVQQLGIN